MGNRNISFAICRQLGSDEKYGESAEICATASGSSGSLGRAVSPGQRYNVTLLQCAALTNSSAPAMSHVLGKLVAHVDRLQRSLLFEHFRPEQGPINFIYRPSAPPVSRNQIDAFIEKRRSRPPRLPPSEPTAASRLSAEYKRDNLSNER